MYNFKLTQDKSWKEKIASNVGIMIGGLLVGGLAAYQFKQYKESQEEKLKQLEFILAKAKNFECDILEPMTKHGALRSYNSSGFKFDFKNKSEDGHTFGGKMDTKRYCADKGEGVGDDKSGSQKKGED